MNLTIAESIDFVRGIRRGLNDVRGVDRVLCPPFTALATLKELLAATGIGLGAQNMHWEDKGAYTGEIAPGMLKELCQYVILGHSERRAYFGETDEGVNRKVKAALAHTLRPIVCVGETEAQYDAGQTKEVVGGQVRGCLEGLTAEQVAGLVIAYEPVWAIGTGKTATGTDAAEMADAIRATIADLAGAEFAGTVPVLYGGSVTADSFAEFIDEPSIDGALIGGASLKPDQMAGIAATAAEAAAARAKA
jgi:triosephosphate isomerase